MAKEVMERRASDNKYLHKDFHNLMNLGIEYIREKYGEDSVREYLARFAKAYYAPLKSALLKKGLIAVKEHYEKIYETEEALDFVSMSLSEDELIINVEKCPAVTHEKIRRNSPPLYYELIKRLTRSSAVPLVLNCYPMIRKQGHQEKDFSGKINSFIEKERSKMISCTEFIPAYSELFKYIEEIDGEEGVLSIGSIFPMRD